MAMWHCPHCGAPQAESARCWVCRRSSTTCSTCRSFRRAVAGELGYCGLDARRAPLTGLELRGCWQPARAGLIDPAPTIRAAGGAAARLRGGPPVTGRSFVPLEQLVPGLGAAGGPEAVASTTLGTGATLDTSSTLGTGEAGWAERGTLFGEIDA